MRSPMIIENTLAPSQFMATSAGFGAVTVVSSADGGKMLFYLLLFLMAVAILYGLYVYLEDKRIEQ